MESYCKFLRTEKGVLSYGNFRSFYYGETDAVVELVSALLRGLNGEGTPVSICDLGGGDGYRLSRILMRSRMAPEEVVVIEQSPMMAVGAKRTLRGCAVRQRVLCCRMEDLIWRGRFKVVLALHSMFTLEPAIGWGVVNEMKEDAGLAIVASNSEDGFLGRAKARIDAYLGEARQEVGAYLRIREKGCERRLVKEVRRSLVISWEAFEEFVRVAADWLSLGRSDSRVEEFVREEAFQHGCEVAEGLAIADSDTIIIEGALETEIVTLSTGVQAPRVREALWIGGLGRTVSNGEVVASDLQVG